MSTENKRLKSKELFESYEHIIKLFSESERGMTTEEIYQAMVQYHQFSKSKKTIENYLKDIMGGMILGVELIWVKRGRHKIKDHRDVSPEALKKHLEKLESEEVVYGEEKAYMRLAMESIRELDTLSSKHHKEIEKRLGISGIESPYFIDNEDMESIDMSDTDIIDLKDAINKDAIAEFKYIGKSRKDWYVVEPYKLIVFDGLWYLFGKDTNDQTTPYKTWRLIYIKDVDYARDGSIRHTMPDDHSESILQKAEHAKFYVCTTGKEPIVQKNLTIQLRICSDIVEEFDHKAHIPGEVSEPILNDDGSLMVTTKVNTTKDVEAAIKSLLPHVEIIEPIEYRKEFLLKIEKYRDKFKDEIETLRNSGDF